MNLLSTFVSGFSDLIKVQLPKIVPDAEIHLLSDGLVYYSTQTQLDEKSFPRMFNNTFVVLSHQKVSEDANPQLILKNLAREADWQSNKNLSGKTFRFFVSRESEIIAIPKSLRRSFGEAIARKTKLTLSPLKADNEFWFIIRREGYAFFCLRRSILKKNPQKGELRPEIAHCLALLADLQPTDTILDPFGGFGAIPEEISNQFQYKEIIISDAEESKCALLEDAFKEQKNVKIYCQDAQNMNKIQSSSIDKIITDPPWGIYSQENVEELYKAMLLEFDRVLTSQGIVVILTAQKEMLLDSIVRTGLFKIVEKYDILVSGKKAGTYRIKRTDK